MEQISAKETVYLAGKITGDMNYKAKFAAAAEKLEAAGFAVVNPAVLPERGFTYPQYIRMSQAMLDECDAICLLPDWIRSSGAAHEHMRARDKHKRVFLFAEWEAEQESGVQSGDE